MEPINLKSNIMDIFEDDTGLKTFIHTDPYGMHLLMLIVVDAFIGSREEESGKALLRTLIGMNHKERVQLIAAFYIAYRSAKNPEEISKLLHKVVN